METETSTAPRGQTSGGSNYAIPISIVIAGLLIAFALYARPEQGQIQPIDDGTAAVAGAQGTGQIVMKDISPDEHILGNPNAPIIIVEYSDLECPFCKQFHSTVKSIMDEYGPEGKVAWVYRHFPLDSLHPKARGEAVATECANKLGGNEKFWAYTDKIFEITPSNNQLDLTLLPKIATDIGLDRGAFEECLGSTEFDTKIEDSIQDAVSAGARGTPYSLIVYPGGKTPINGAQPYAIVRQMVEDVLQSIQ